MIGTPSLDAVLVGLDMPSSKAAMNPDGQDIKKAAQKLESLFISEMLKGLKKTLPGESFLPKGTGSDMYEAILDTALVEGLSQRGLGFSDAFERMYGRQVQGEDPAPESGAFSAYTRPVYKNDTVGVSILA